MSTGSRAASKYIRLKSHSAGRLPPVAMRSSGVGEILPTRSFSGLPGDSPDTQRSTKAFPRERRRELSRFAKAGLG